MLRFQTAPDRVFTEILTEGIEMMISEITDLLEYAEDEKEEKEELKWLLPNASKVFITKTALNTLEQMLICHKKPEVYYLNDYHYLLLYDTLENFCIIKNDLVKDAKTNKDKREISKIGSFYIEELDFDGIIDIYFFDVDFLIDADTIMELGLEGREQLNINKETFALTQGLAPHPEELMIKELKQEKAAIREPSILFGTKSKVYPDYDYLDE